VADGTAGEVHVTGPGVALGYLHRPDLTQQRFVEIRPAHPTAAPVRAYRSGDIAVRNSEGELFYRGRCDDQIKVRGFRVEPHEVEAVLSQGSHVAACCVLPHDYGDGDVRLVAYVVPASAGAAWTDARTDELRRLAAARLPDYMRPSAHVIVDALPLTAHGKLDKQALPAPQSGAWVRAAASHEPMPGEEAFILSVWRDQLGLRDLGPHDEFFDHGGTSLALIRSLSVLKKHYRVELDTGLLADGATAANLAHAIRAALAPTLHATH
jgi:syringomycin synthetase protein SyrB1